MMSLPFRVAQAGLLIAAVACSAWAGAPGAPEAQELGPVEANFEDAFDVRVPFLDEPLKGCGKSQYFRSLAERGLSPAGMLASRPPRWSPGMPPPGMAPDPTDVLNYNLTLEVSPPTNAVIGTNIMTIESKQDGLTTFGFKLRSNMTISECRVKDPNHASWPTGYLVTPSGPPANSYARTITFAQPISNGTVFTVTVKYNGNAANVGFGSFFAGTVLGSPLVNSLSEPYYAATWWPPKDGDVFQPGDNSDKATLDFYIICPNAHKATANGVRISEVTDTPVAGKKTTHYSSIYPISTYLVAFAVSNYNRWMTPYVYGPGQQMNCEFHVLPGDDTGPHRAAWDNSINMLAAFKTFYGEYPFINEKYGIYQMGFGGGMEHQTNTGQGVSGSTPFNETLTAHELGHQWWGDMVTCKHWNDIWLNEGGATYSEALWEESKGANPAAKAANLKTAMQARKPIDPTNTVWLTDAETASLSRIFDGNSSYDKASWILHMLRGIVGDTTYFNFLSAYRAAFEGSAATTADFTALASAVAGQDLSWYFTPWLYSQGAATYQYAWTQSTIEGQTWLRLRIQQTQQASYATYDMPLDIRVNTTAGVVNFSVRSFSRYVNNDPGQGAMANYYLLPLPGNLTGSPQVSLDPDGWVLTYNNTTAGYTPGPPKIVTLTPAPASSAEQSATPTQIRIAFSDPVTANAANFAITVTNGSGTNPVPFSYSYDAPTNAALLTMTPPLAAGTYNVVVSDNITANSQKLDGEMSSNSPAALPSGDAAAGGSAMYTFTVIPDPFCPADFNQSGGPATVQDLFDFLAAWFAQDPSADFNESGSVTVQDLFDYLAAFFTPCP